MKSLNKKWVESLSKYNEWAKTGGPPYMNDEELLGTIEALTHIENYLRLIDGFNLASFKLIMELNSLREIAYARKLHSANFYLEKKDE